MPDFQIKRKWKLPMPLMAFGYVIFKHYLLIFGGSTSGDKFQDAIYLLNLRDVNKGWKKLIHIKCPIASNYIAVLLKDDKNTVHIFATGNISPNWEDSQRGHYSLPIAGIIGPEYTEFDLSILKGIDITTMDTVNGYIRDYEWNVPREIIDICMVFYFFLSYL